MIHHTTTPNNHWAVGYTGEKVTPTDSKVLVQVQEAGNQARTSMSPEQAEAMADELRRFAALARAANRLQLVLTNDAALLKECSELMAAGRKIDAIKFYRERMQCSLGDAKRAVEYLLESVPEAVA